MTARRDDEFTQYVVVKLGSMRRMAYLLCQDWQRADDLVQSAITQLYIHWGRASAMQHTDAYARTILVREFLTEQRLGWHRKVSLDVPLPDTPRAAPDLDTVLDIRAALASLPPRQRATIVLRFHCDLTVEQTAQLLGCSAGTVKSQTAKAMDALRAQLGSSQAPVLAPASNRPDRRGTSRIAKPEVTDHG